MLSNVIVQDSSVRRVRKDDKYAAPNATTLRGCPDFTHGGGLFL